MRMFTISKKKYLLNDMKIFGTCSIPLSTWQLVPFTLALHHLDRENISYHECISILKKEIRSNIDNVSWTFTSHLFASDCPYLRRKYGQTLTFPENLLHMYLLQIVFIYFHIMLVKFSLTIGYNEGDVRGSPGTFDCLLSSLWSVICIFFYLW